MLILSKTLHQRTTSSSITPLKSDIILSKSRKLISIKDFIQLAKEANPASTVFIQADFPNEAKEGYHSKVAQLQDILAEQEIPFIDHWQNWDLTVDYYSTEGTLSEAGQANWQNYLIKYFTGE